MLRRFEMYSVARDRVDECRPGLGHGLSALRGVHSRGLAFDRWAGTSPPPRFSSSGNTPSPRPEAYQRYMVHPFHAAVLDRYLLPDSPERVVTDNDLGAGLVGYQCDGPVFDDERRACGDSCFSASTAGPRPAPCVGWRQALRDGAGRRRSDDPVGRRAPTPSVRPGSTA